MDTRRAEYQYSQLSGDGVRSEAIIEPSKPTWRLLQSGKATLLMAGAALAALVVIVASIDAIVRFTILSQQRAARTTLPIVYRLNQTHPASDGRKINILHLIDHATMESTMDRWFMRSQQEFTHATDLVLDAPLWGRGFPDWDNSATIQANIARKFGSATYFDAILAYYNGDQDEHLGIDPAPRFLQLAEISKLGVVIIDRPHEMRDKRRVPMYDLANVSLVIAPYPQELLDYKDYGKQALLVHQPHPVEPRLFQHDVEGLRDIDVFLAGSLEAGMYPLRHRLSKLIQSHVLPGIIRKHPGYPDILTPADRQKYGITAESMEQQLVDFSNDLGRSEICLVTASRWQYSIQKYGEAAAAGCMMIGTLPLDRRDEFKEHVIEISNSMHENDIYNIIHHWLKVDRAGRIERAKKAQRWFTSKYSGQKYVEDIVGWIKLVQSGKRGLMLPHQWDFPPAALPDDG